MDRTGRDSLLNLTVALALIVAASLLRILNRGVSALPDLLRAFIYIGLGLWWGESVRSRIMAPAPRRHLTQMSMLMVIWVVIRTIKFEFCPVVGTVTRYLWYSFYVPMTVIPFLGLLTAMEIGRPDDQQAPGWTRMLALPAALLCVMVLTNDMHQMAFGFPYGLERYDEHYTHKVIYWLTVIWIVGLLAASLVIIIRRSRRALNRRMLWLPFTMLALGVGYTMIYIYNQPLLHVLAGDMTVSLCLINTAIWESCITMGLIPSNRYYVQLFAASTIAAQIVDGNYETVYASQQARPLNKATMRQAAAGPVDLDVHTRLSSAPIQGGHVLWLQDVTAVNEMVAQLRHSGALTAETNEMLRAEMMLKARQIRIAEQNSLYDRIAHDANRQIQAIYAMLADADHDGCDLDGLLARICVLSAFVKRRSNLVLISQGHERIEAQELGLCLRESMENIRMTGARATLLSRCTGSVEPARAELLYDVFEQGVEDVLDGLQSAAVTLTAAKGQGRLTFTAGGTRTFRLDGAAERLGALGGRLTLDGDGRSAVMDVQLPLYGQARS